MKLLQIILAILLLPLTALAAIGLLVAYSIANFIEDIYDLEDEYGGKD